MYGSKYMVRTVACINGYDEVSDHFMAMFQDFLGHRKIPRSLRGCLHAYFGGVVSADLERELTWFEWRRVWEI